jgi:uncharacterized lipoprotein YmbA
MRADVLSAAAVLLMLARCGSTPTRVFDLSPGRPSALSVAVTQARCGPLIWVDRPSVAGYFDRTQMVTRAGSNRISIHEFEVWSDPPADLIQRALVDDLARQFGADCVMATPVARSVTPGWLVQLDVLRFDVDDRGTAVLDARWNLVPGGTDKRGASRRETIATTSGDAVDPDKRVMALREAVEILAGLIGKAIAEPGPR